MFSLTGNEKNEMEPIISLKNVFIRQGETFSLSIETLRLFPQRIYALTGPNGSGKSTLLRTLALLTPPQRGAVRFANAGESPDQRRRKVTLVEQSPYLFKGTVSDNLAFGLKLRGIKGNEQQRRIASALELVGLGGFEQRKADKLSGGEAQRVAVARALALEPKVLLLDEPTSNIDSDNLQVFETLLRRLPEHGVTVVFSTHDIAQPERLGVETIRIENGRLSDCPHWVLEHHGVRKTEKRGWLKPLSA